MPKNGKDCQSRTARRQSSKTALRKWAQRNTKGTRLRAIRKATGFTFRGDKIEGLAGYPAGNAEILARLDFEEVDLDSLPEFSATHPGGEAPVDGAATQLLRDIFEAQDEPDGSCHANTAKDKPCQKSARDGELFCSTHKPVTV